MKISTAELATCGDVYSFLLWFEKYHEVSIPIEQDVFDLLEAPHIQTIGVWFDNLGLVAAIRINISSLDTYSSIRKVEFPLDFKCAAAILSDLERRYPGGPCLTPRPARLTLWVQPDISKSPSDEQMTNDMLVRIGFRRELANNWDYIV
jgi:hypothetical protein